MTATMDPMPEWALNLAEKPAKESKTFGLDSFTGRLIWIRGKTHLSQVQFAKRLEVPTATYRTWELGTTPSTPTQVDLCALIEEKFGVPKEWLAWGPDTKQCSGWLFTLREGYGDAQYGDPRFS